MCYGCYEEYNCPAIINDKTKTAAKLVEKVYELNEAGGSCHIVIDDFNIEDCHIQWCLDEGLKTNIHEHDKTELAIERELLDTFLSMTIEERASALAIYEGWIS